MGLRGIFDASFIQFCLLVLVLLLIHHGSILYILWDKASHSPNEIQLENKGCLLRERQLALVVLYLLHLVVQHRA